MSNRGFPTASAFLEMEERRRQYRKHIDALRSCKHLVDDSQPIPPKYLVNRRTRQTKIQMYIMRTGEENIRLISRYNESRNKNKKSSSQLKIQNNRPNWVNKMYNSMGVSRSLYSRSDQEPKSQKLPPLNSSIDDEEIQKDEKQEIEEQESNNTNANTKEEEINKDTIENNSDNNNQNDIEVSDQKEVENVNQNQRENEKDIENDNEEEDKNEIEEENKNEIEGDNENQNTNENEEESKNENEVANDNNTEKENANETPDSNVNDKQNESIETNEDNNPVDTTLGEAGEKGRLGEMLDVLNGITE